LLPSEMSVLRRAANLITGPEQTTIPRGAPFKAPPGGGNAGLVAPQIGILAGHTRFSNHPLIRVNLRFPTFNTLPTRLFRGTC